ncbi:MAG: hypothetical protein HY661_17495 [Betaproteobacteria bacterium]|nr:hypothetical protein [Betaproteobacteria bacterium]
MAFAGPVIGRYNARATGNLLSHYAAPEPNVGKIILFLVLAVAAYLFIRGAMRTKRGDTRADRHAETPAENMKACARCGVNLPRSEALEADGNYFCSEEHRRLGAK